MFSRRFGLVTMTLLIVKISLKQKTFIGAIHLQASLEAEANFDGLKTWPNFLASSIGLFSRPVKPGQFKNRPVQKQARKRFQL